MTTWWNDLHYGAWLGHWHRAAGTQFPSRDSLNRIDQQIRADVLATTEEWMTGEGDNVPVGQPREIWVIAAELRPLQTMITGELTSRPLTGSEQRLLEAETWMDRPSLDTLTEVGEDLKTASNTLHWHPLGWLPTELTVIAQAANLPVHSLYSL